MMKKVCFLMATPFTLGGEQRVVTIISNLLIDKGYDVTILCSDNQTEVNYDIYKLNKNVKIKFIDGYNNEKCIKKRIKREKMYLDNAKYGYYKYSLLIQKYINCDRYTRKLLINKINEDNYDYIISLSTIYNTMLSTISKKIKAKTIGWQHSCSERYFDLKGERHYNQDKFTKYMFKNLDRYIVLSNSDKEYLKKKFNVDTTVINNPKSIISKKVSNLNNKQFIAVGRLVEVKNFSMLIDMFNEFHKKNKDWKLIIIGEGDQKEILNKKINDYKLNEHIILEGYKSNVEKYYLESSIYLMSSLYEGWGMVIGEAIEFGLPIISFNITSAKEMIKDGYNGYIIENYNQKKYVDSMLKLANDKELLIKMGKNSKEQAKKMSNTKIIKQWEKLFKNI